MIGRGNSSAIDYAISVNPNLGISDSYMFRNIYSDDICLYKNSINQCLSYSQKHCKNYIDQYSNKNMIDKFYNIIVNL